MEAFFTFVSDHFAFAILMFAMSLTAATLVIWRLLLNFGARTNMDRLKRDGSGYAASHGPDFLKTNDAWSQMLNFRYGPDGSVHVIDWYYKNQCHSSNPEVHDKTLGRIYKIRHENDKWVSVDLRKQSSEQLV